MTDSTDLFVGLDVSDRKTAMCVMNAKKFVVKETTFASTPAGLSKALGGYRGCRAVLETGMHSLWMRDRIRELGLTPVVCDAGAAKGASLNRPKTDRRDARTLAELLRTDSEALHPVELRPTGMHADLSIVRARVALVETRTKLINTCRGIVKSFGVRLSARTTDSFGLTWPEVPEPARPALEELYKLIAAATSSIRASDKLVNETAEKKYPETQRLTQVSGVGNLIALAFFLTLWNASRFKRARSAGAYLGLAPRQYASGDSNPELRITKRGDALVRRLLVQSAHYVIGPFGPDCDLRRFGLKLVARGGKWAKQRAAVAVARRLAGLLTALWKSGAKYEPLRTAEAAQPA